MGICAATDGGKEVHWNLMHVWP